MTETPRCTLFGVRLKHWLALVLIAVAGFGVWTFWNNLTVRVVFDNHHFAPVQVYRDGELWVTLEPGESRVEWSTRATFDLRFSDGWYEESLEASTESLGLISNVFSGGAYVCSPYGLGIYVDHEESYDLTTVSRDPVVHLTSSWFEVPKVDFLLQAPPKRAWTSAFGSPFRYVLENKLHRRESDVVQMLEKRDRLDGAIAFLQRSAQRDPENYRHYEILGDLMSRHGEIESVLNWVEERRSVRPVDVNAHRFYQEMHLEMGQAEAMDVEYRKYLEQEPENIQLQYLYGRVATEQRARKAAYVRAIMKAPKDVWASRGMVYLLMAEGKFDDAVPVMRRYRELLRNPAVDADVHWRVLMAAKQWDALREALWPVADLYHPRPDTDAVNAWGLMLILTDADDLQWESWQSMVRKVFPSTGWISRLNLLRLRWRDRKSEGSDPWLRKMGSTAWTQAFGIYLQRSELEEAATILDDHWDALDGTERIEQALLLGICLENAGQGDEARKWYSRTASETARSELMQLLTSMLSDDAPSVRLVEAMPGRSAGIAAMAAAVRSDDPAEREQWLDRAERLSYWQMMDALFLVRWVFR